MDTTLNSAVSGMAPPLVMAVMRAPRRARRRLIHAIAMDVGAVASALGGDALGEHLEDCVEFLAREIAIRIRALHQREEFVFVAAGFGRVSIFCPRFQPRVCGLR